MKSGFCSKKRNYFSCDIFFLQVKLFCSIIIIIEKFKKMPLKAGET